MTAPGHAELLLLPQYTGQALLLHAYDGEPGSLFHYHPEFELVMVRGCVGRRLVGDDMSSYGDCDLVLFGPNLPHTWLTEHDINLDHKKDVTVVQFTLESLGFEFMLRQEMKGIKALLDRSDRGLYFDRAHAQRALALMGRLLQLDACERLLTVLTILNLLSKNKYAAPIVSERYRFHDNEDDHREYARILDYIHRESDRPITLAESADCLSMSVPTFVRFFRRMSGTSFIDYVQEWRIARACTLLAETDLSVMEISTTVGFNTASHFHKQFLRRRGITPRSYRLAAENRSLLTE